MKDELHSYDAITEAGGVMKETEFTSLHLQNPYTGSYESP
jgi:hypothetical protein